MTSLGHNELKLRLSSSICGLQGPTHPWPINSSRVVSGRHCVNGHKVGLHQMCKVGLHCWGHWVHRQRENHPILKWWDHHDMEILSALLTPCVGNPLIPPHKLLVMQSFNVYCWLDQAVEQMINLLVMWDAMTLVWQNCAQCIYSSWKTAPSIIICYWTHPGRNTQTFITLQTKNKL